LVGKNRNFLLNDNTYQIIDTSRDVVGYGHHDSNKYFSSITQLRRHMKDLEQEIGRVEKEFRPTRTNYDVRQGSDAAAAIDTAMSNAAYDINSVNSDLANSDSHIVADVRADRKVQQPLSARARVFTRRHNSSIQPSSHTFSASAARNSKTHGGRHPCRRHKGNADGSSSDLSSEYGSTSSIRNSSEEDNNHENGQGGYRRPLHRRRHSHRHRSSKIPWMKPDKFNGHGSFETLITQFENCSRYCGWSSEDKVAHLRWALTGTAAQLLWGTEGLSYDE